MINSVKDEVSKLLDKDKSGHGIEHVSRVFKMAMDLCEKEKANKDIVALAALLHDCDDYKLFGQECAENLTNSKDIMNKVGISKDIQNKVCEIISTMGYSNSLNGIRPTTIEGKIVSDADMLDTIGIMGCVRTLMYTLSKGTKEVFNRDIFPEPNLSQEEYKKPNRKSDTFINHHFDKLLKLKNMIFTSSGKEEASRRHASMVMFLREFFREQGEDKWIEYLEEYERNNK